MRQSLGARLKTIRHTGFATEALLACAGEGITLLFLDHFGQPLARVMGRPGERQGLHQRLLELFDHPDGEDRYRDWLRANRRRVGGAIALPAHDLTTIMIPRSMTKSLD